MWQDPTGKKHGPDYGLDSILNPKGRTKDQCQELKGNLKGLNHKHPCYS